MWHFNRWLSCRMYPYGVYCFGIFLIYIWTNKQRLASDAKGSYRFCKYIICIVNKHFGQCVRSRRTYAFIFALIMLATSSFLLHLEFRFKDNFKINTFFYSILFLKCDLAFAYIHAPFLILFYYILYWVYW